MTLNFAASPLRPVLILHGAANAPTLPLDEQDALHEVEAAAGALRQLGYDPIPLAVTLDLRPLAAALAERRPIAVFNLVETVEQQGRFAHLPTALLDACGIPYTGCPTAAIFETTAKILAKQRLAAAGISTPAWLAPLPTAAGDSAPSSRWILKPTCEDASVGIDSGAVVTVPNAHALREALATRTAQLGHELFAEEYIDGREISISLIEGSDGVETLPPSEILFIDFPPDRPRIVDYRSKWEVESFEYRHTPRSLDFSAAEAPLLANLAELALRCWNLFGLRGYARVDFRVDANLKPWVLEVNANPALGPDSGFMASVVRHGRDPNWAFQQILECALRGRSFPFVRAERTRR